MKLGFISLPTTMKSCFCKLNKHFPFSFSFSLPTFPCITLGHTRNRVLEFVEWMLNLCELLMRGSTSKGFFFILMQRVTVQCSYILELCHTHAPFNVYNFLCRRISHPLLIVFFPPHFLSGEIYFSIDRKKKSNV